MKLAKKYPGTWQRATRQYFKDWFPKEETKSVFEQSSLHSPEEIETELNIIYGESDINLITTFPFQELEG